jgi:hypothetical protein
MTEKSKNNPMMDQKDPHHQVVAQTPELHLQKFATHQSLSNHLAKFPHHTHLGLPLLHYQNNGLISPTWPCADREEETLVAEKVVEEDQHQQIQPPTLQLWSHQLPTLDPWEPHRPYSQAIELKLKNFSMS